MFPPMLILYSTVQREEYSRLSCGIMPRRGNIVTLTLLALHFNGPEAFLSGSGRVVLPGSDLVPHVQGGGATDLGSDAPLHPRQRVRGCRRLCHVIRSSTMKDVAPKETEKMVEGQGEGKKKVVVIGAGWAGLAAAYELSKQVKRRISVTSKLEVQRMKHEKTVCIDNIALSSRISIPTQRACLRLTYFNALSS